MKKFLSLVLSMFMIFGLVACGSSSSNATSATNAPVSENATVETEAAKKKLVMCTNAEFPPYEYHDGNNIIGIDVDIINAIAKMKGFDVEIMDISLTEELDGKEAENKFTELFGEYDKAVIIDFKSAE